MSLSPRYIMNGSSTQFEVLLHPYYILALIFMMQNDSTRKVEGIQNLFAWIVDKNIQILRNLRNASQLRQNLISLYT